MKRGMNQHSFRFATLILQVPDAFWDIILTFYGTVSPSLFHHIWFDIFDVVACAKQVVFTHQSHWTDDLKAALGWFVAGH